MTVVTIRRMTGQGVLVRRDRMTAIDEMLDGVQRPPIRCRTLSARDVVAALAALEEHLGGDRASRVGVSAWLSDGSAVANAYRGRAERTEARVIGVPGGWRVVQVARRPAPHRSYGAATHLWHDLTRPESVTA